MAGSTPDGPASDALLDDVVVMTRQAAVDGLSLAAVFDDLRLVLDLSPSDDLPSDVLRACAVAWAETHQEQSATGGRGVACGTRADLEGYLWGLLADPATELPDRAIVVSLARPAAVLRDADVLLVAAGHLQAVFDGPGEHVMVIRPDRSPQPDRVVVLAREVGDRLGTAGPWTDAVVTTVHDLRDDPDGSLAALRRVLDAR